MPLAPPVYRKVPGHPIYYKVDFGHQMIESIKDWMDRSKSIDTYNFFGEFAENISDIYEPISQTAYETIRAYVKLQEQNAGKSIDQSVQPQCALNA